MHWENLEGAGGEGGGRGYRDGEHNTCKPMAVSFQCMTKSTRNKNKQTNKQTKNDLVKALGKLFTFIFYSASPGHFF